MLFRFDNNKSSKWLLKPMEWALLLLAIPVGVLLATIDFSSAPVTFDEINQQANIVGFATVLDGDTIRINGRRIRLNAIDAPEMAQSCQKPSGAYKCGINAKSFLISIINNSEVRCISNEKDTYGRDLAICYNSAGQDLNALMVSSGNAIAYLYYSNAYASQQRQAKSKELGIWQGKFTEPYLFRRNNR